MLSVLIPCLIAFFATLWITKPFIRLLELEGLVGHDQMKPGKPKVAEMGAPPVLFGFLGGIFAYIAAQTFFIKTMAAQELLGIMAVITTIIIITFIGLMDELTMLIKEREGHGIFEKFKRRGLAQWMQVVLPLPAAIPLMAVSIGISTISIPLLGTYNIGILYPLVLVPLAIVGAANATNMLAGFNGLQAGLGIVLSLFLGVFTYIQGSYAASLIAFIFAAALLAFLKFNWYPAKIFPGGLDYLTGAVIACIAIVGNVEKFAILCFAPYFIELVLKARSRFKAENFGILQKDGTLKAPTEKTQSITHIVMKLGRFKEWQVTSVIILAFVAWCGLMFVLNVI